MPVPDNERFEHYLRQFRPIAAEPLPLPRPRTITRRWHWFAFAAAATTVLLVTTIVLFKTRSNPAPSHNAPIAKYAEQLVNAPRLTSRSTSGDLEHARTFEDALDSIAFTRQRISLAKGTQSALAALGKEDFKL
jgi:hypothetical protein